MGRTNSAVNRVAPGSTSGMTGANSTSVSAGMTRFQPRATAPSTDDISAPRGEAFPDKLFVRGIGIFAGSARSGESDVGWIRYRAKVQKARGGPKRRPGPARIVIPDAYGQMELSQLPILISDYR